LFLPAMWRHLPDPRQFLHHLKQKAGLDAEHWSPAFRASRFRIAEIRQQPPNVLRVLLRLASRHQTASAV
jgi:hypothetical protein